jgi:hypothetical protein
MNVEIMKVKGIALVRRHEPAGRIRKTEGSGNLDFFSM